VSVTDTLERARRWADLPASDKIFGYYQDDLDRALTPDLRLLLPDFARLMVAAQDWIGEEEALAILNHTDGTGVRTAERRWDLGELDAMTTALTWLLKRQVRSRDGGEPYCLLLQHESVRDFLTSTKYRGPARSGVPEMHRRIGRYYLSRSREGGWTKTEEYGRFFAVRHLLAAGDRESVAQAADLLTDLDYLRGTLGEVPPEAADD
jgi:hypothetical protein